MKLLIRTCLLLGLLSGTIVHAGFVITSEDFVLKPENVRIAVSQNIFKEEAQISYRTCNSCTWVSYPTTEKTRFHNSRKKINFADFKKLIALPSKKNLKVLISISHHSNSVRVIKWNYEAY